MTTANRLAVLALAACAARPSRAALLAPITELNVSVSPILVTAPDALVNPALQRLDWRARQLLALGGGLGLSPAEAGAFVTALASPAAPQVDRLAAGALARLIDEPGLAERFAARRPELRGASYLRASRAVLSSDPYRGGAPTSRAIAQIAAAARGAAAVSALLDGRTDKAELPDARLSGSALYLGSRRAREVTRTQGGRLYVHPDAADATIEAFYERHAPLADAQRMIPDAQPVFSALAYQGHAPATLGWDYLFVSDLGDAKPVRALVARERVSGETVAKLIESGGVSVEDRALVRDLLLAVASAGGDIRRLQPNDVLVGTTALRPERRAYVVDVHALRRPDKRTDANVEAARWIENVEIAAALELRRAAMSLRRF